jgi:DNA repair protein RecN (Recombination protein N)
VLRELRIRNFALIDELELSFEPGFNVVTGETGAGKTLLMQAVGLAVGGKAANEVIRTGEEEATIEAVFSVASGPVAERLVAAGIECPGAELRVRRVVSSKGRNRVHLNGGPATLSLLESLGGSLIRIYGQHEHHTLRQADTHLGLLDSFAGHGAEVARMREAFAAFHELDERLRRLAAGREAARARAEWLRFQAREIAEARLRPGEEEELREERAILAAAEKLAAAATTGEELLYAGEGAAASAVKRVAQRLSELVSIDRRLEEIAGLLEEAARLLEEAGFRLRDYGRRISFDPERLEAVEERLARIAALKRKYGGSVEEILAHSRAVEQELADLDLGEEGVAALGAERAAAERAAEEMARRLSEARRAAARRLEERLAAELAGLGMAGARVEVRFAPVPLGENGIDGVEFFLAANPGEAPRPLARIASGGELSRIMLALKTIALGEGEAETLVFDEVDAGIGGAVAEVVGRKLAAVSQGRQVLCITHLPQIAVWADHHYAVEKATVRGRTRSTVRKLSSAERADEIARMIGGVRVGPEARRHAARLLAAARNRP